MSDDALCLLVVIPLTADSCIGPNARCHWRARGTQVATLRYAAGLATRDALARRRQAVAVPDDGPIGIRWTFLWGKGRRMRDDDNLIGGIAKHCRDQIAAELGIDDKRLTTLGVLQVRTGERQSEVHAALIVTEGVE